MSYGIGSIALEDQITILVDEKGINMADAPTASAAAVATEIRRRRPRIGKAKLHKLLYYVQGYHLAWEGGPAFNDDIEAWERGPVVASLWHAEKHGVQVRPEPLPQSVNNIVTNVLCRFGNETGASLIAATHDEGPWLNATQGGTVVANQLISHQSLIDFFSIESPEVQRLREALDAVRDDSPFVPDPPGALEALLAEYQRK